MHSIIGRRRYCFQESSGNPRGASWFGICLFEYGLNDATVGVCVSGKWYSCNFFDVVAVSPRHGKGQLPIYSPFLLARRHYPASRFHLTRYVNSVRTCDFRFRSIITYRHHLLRHTSTTPIHLMAVSTILV